MQEGTCGLAQDTMAGWPLPAWWGADGAWLQEWTAPPSSTNPNAASSNAAAAAPVAMVPLAMGKGQCVTLAW